METHEFANPPSRKSYRRRESSKQAMGIEVTEDELKDEQTQTDAPQEAPEFELKWHDDALQKVMRIPISFIRNMAVKRIEQEVRKNEGPNKEVSMELFEKYRFSF